MINQIRFFNVLMESKPVGVLGQFGKLCVSEIRYTDRARCFPPNNHVIPPNVATWEYAGQRRFDSYSHGHFTNYLKYE
jgi:hypothetical protein